MYGSYALTFFLGSVWIGEQYRNHIYERAYTSGDILACFFGVIIGMTSLGQAQPNIKAVSEGQAAAKMVYDIIDRKPSIPLDDPSA